MAVSQAVTTEQTQNDYGHLWLYFVSSFVLTSFVRLSTRAVELFSASFSAPEQL